MNIKNKEIKLDLNNNQAHYEVVKEINKGDYDYNTKTNYAQITYDKKNHTENCPKNLNMDKLTNYENQDEEKRNSNNSGSINSKNKDQDYNNDETTTNKNERDFEKIPSEKEKFNKKVNKRMNKIEEKKMDNIEKIQSSQNKKAGMYSSALENIEVIAKF